jgi:hypothetical protein
MCKEALVTIPFLSVASGLVPMDPPGPYLHWGVIQISVANLIVIVLMLAVFALALFLPFPGRKS